MIEARWLGWFLVAVVIVYVLMPGISYGAVWAIEESLGIGRFGSLSTNIIFALPIMLFGWAWMVWSTFTLESFGRGHCIHAFGKAPEQTRSLCLMGPYKYTQNPMYFGWLVLMAGLGVAIGSVVFIVFVPVFWTVFIYLYLPRYEWPGLWKRFGPEWLSWHRQTPVIFPALYRRWTIEADRLADTKGQSRAS
jgi:protein-S-isoprenylcysteine O-methyltransferase Ste14